MNFSATADGEHRQAAAFSLVEMLVATTIFLILIVVFAQLVTNVSVFAARENDTMDSVGDTRQALNRFEMDWFSRVRRPDVDWVINNPGSANVNPGAAPSNIIFVSQVTALDGARGVVSVAYRINPANFALERGTSGYDWTGSANSSATSNLLTFHGTISSLLPFVPPDADFEAIAPAVFRFCLSYLDARTGKWTVSKPTANLNPRGTWISMHAPNFAALALTVAALNKTDRVLLNNTQMESLSSALNDLPNTNFPDTQDPMVVWNAELNTPGFRSKAGVPQRIIAAVRIQQKIFYQL